MTDDTSRWRGVPHLGEVMHLRGITANLVHLALNEPDAIQSASRGRIEYLKRYHDAVLNREMLLRVIVDPGHPCSC